MTIVGFGRSAAEQSGNDVTATGYVGAFLAVVANRVQSGYFWLSQVTAIRDITLLVVGITLIKSRGWVFRFLARRISRWLTTPGFA